MPDKENCWDGKDEENSNENEKKKLIRIWSWWKLSIWI